MVHKLIVGLTVKSLCDSMIQLPVLYIINPFWGLVLAADTPDWRSLSYPLSPALISAITIVGTSKKGRLKLPAPSTGSAAVSFILQGLLCSWAHLSLQAKAAQKCGRINGLGYNITRRQQGQLYKRSSLLAFQRSRIEPRLPIVSAFRTHPYIQFSFLSASLPAPSLMLPRITSQVNY